MFIYKTTAELEVMSANELDAYKKLEKAHEKAEADKAVKEAVEKTTEPLINELKEVKEEIFAKHGGKAENTGSAEGQIALFTHRISHLTEHLKKNRHDYNTERSLVLLVGKRRSLLDYLKKKEINRYREIIKVLGIRK